MPMAPRAQNPAAAHAVQGAGVTAATYSTMWVAGAVVVSIAVLLAPRMKPVTR